MSVKFEKDTIKQTAGIAGTQGISTMRGGKHELAAEIGTALTGGKGNVGQPGYLAVSHVERLLRICCSIRKFLLMLEM